MASSKTTSKEPDPHQQIQNIVEALKKFRTTFLEKAFVKGTCALPETFTRLFECFGGYGEITVWWDRTRYYCDFQKTDGANAAWCSPGYDEVVTEENVVKLEDYEEMLFSFWSYAKGRPLDVSHGGDKRCSINWQIKADAASVLEKTARDIDRLLLPLSDVRGCEKYADKVAKVLRNGNPKWRPCRVQWTYVKELDEMIQGLKDKNKPQEKGGKSIGGKVDSTNEKSSYSLFWRHHWKWIIGTSIALIGTSIALIAFIWSIMNT